MVSVNSQKENVNRFITRLSISLLMPSKNYHSQPLKIFLSEKLDYICQFLEFARPLSAVRWQKTAGLQRPKH